MDRFSLKLCIYYINVKINCFMYNIASVRFIGAVFLLKNLVFLKKWTKPMIRISVWFVMIWFFGFSIFCSPLSFWTQERWKEDSRGLPLTIEWRFFLYLRLESLTYHQKWHFLSLLHRSRQTCFCRRTCDYLLMYQGTTKTCLLPLMPCIPIRGIYFHHSFGVDLSPRELSIRT